MDALPPIPLPPDGTLFITGMACPDCGGVLQIRRMGTGDHLEFECRIGHLYALPDLLVGKERDLEHRLWAAAEAAEEMHALMRDLVARGQLDPETAEAFAERRDSAQVLGRAVRAAIENDRPARLKPGETVTGEYGASGA